MNALDIQMSRWNSYAHRNITKHCPKTGHEFEGSSTTCPDCFTSFSDRSHWKWYSPDEPHPGGFDQ